MPLVPMILAAVLTVVLAGSSPSAKYVDRLIGLNRMKYSEDVMEDATLDIVGLVTKHGYPIESHDVVTDDGYILTVHRVPHARDNPEPAGNKTVVFIMHGLLSSSADFFVLGPENGLGYILADAGYDVWLGNARGNFYSRRHKRLDPNNRLKPQFWKFSWDEIGNKDLSAVLTYIENVTGESRLHYIGHSQGGTAFLVLTSLRPEYNKKIISFQGMAPVSYFTNNAYPLFTAVAPLQGVLEPAAFALGLGELFPNREFSTWFATNFCFKQPVPPNVKPFCDSVLIAGVSNNANQTLIPVFFGHAPAGSSTRQFSHYAQNIKFNTFRRYDFDPITNLFVYGSIIPPDYNISSIVVPSYIHYSAADKLVNFKDVEKLASVLGNVVDLKMVDSPTFDHLDFIWGNDVKALTYDKILGDMRKAETKG